MTLATRCVAVGEREERRPLLSWQPMSYKIVLRLADRGLLVSPCGKELRIHTLHNVCVCVRAAYAQRIAHPFIVRCLEAHATHPRMRNVEL